MSYYIFWFNILGFALLSAALGVTFAVYRKRNPFWLRPYILYMTVYVLFSYLSTIHYFGTVYLDMTSTGELSFIIAAFFIACSLLLIVPWFVFKLVYGELTSKMKAVISTLITVFIFLFIIFILFPELDVSRLGSVYLNASLGSITLFGVAMLKRKADAGMRKDLKFVIFFLCFTGIFYFVVMFQVLLLPLFLNAESISNANLVTSGFISFIWSVFTLGYVMFNEVLKTINNGDDVSEIFIDNFGITAREREVLNLMLKGRSNREIAAELFISPRTVEAHMYKIYKKCTVKNRVELIRLTSG